MTRVARRRASYYVCSLEEARSGAFVGGRPFGTERAAARAADERAGRRAGSTVIVRRGRRGATIVAMYL